MRNVLAILALLGLVTWGFLYQGNKTDEAGQTSTQMQLSKVPPEDVGLQREKVAPDFTLRTLNGQEMKLSDFRGKRVF